MVQESDSASHEKRRHSVSDDDNEISQDEREDIAEVSCFKHGSSETYNQDVALINIV